MAESREDVERALADLGWESRRDESGAVMGGHGKYYLMVGSTMESPCPSSSPT